MSISWKMDIGQIVNAVEFCEECSLLWEENMCLVLSEEKGKISLRNDIKYET